MVQNCESWSYLLPLKQTICYKVMQELDFAFNPFYSNTLLTGANLVHTEAFVGLSKIRDPYHWLPNANVKHLESIPAAPVDFLFPPTYSTAEPCTCAGWMMTPHPTLPCVSTCLLSRFVPQSFWLVTGLLGKRNQVWNRKESRRT